MTNRNEWNEAERRKQCQKIILNDKYLNKKETNKQIKLWKTQRFDEMQLLTIALRDDHYCCAAMCL